MRDPNRALVVDGFPTVALDPYARTWLPAGYLLRHPQRVTAPVGFLTTEEFFMLHLTASLGHPSRAFRHN
jgi:hypothetical protein